MYYTYRSIVSGSAGSAKNVSFEVESSLSVQNTSKGPGSIFQSANVNRYDHSDDTERTVPSVVVVPALQSLKI